MWILALETPEGHIQNNGLDRTREKGVRGGHGYSERKNPQLADFFVLISELYKCIIYLKIMCVYLINIKTYTVKSVLKYYSSLPVLFTHRVMFFLG